MRNIILTTSLIFSIFSMIFTGFAWNIQNRTFNIEYSPRISASLSDDNIVVENISNVSAYEISILYYYLEDIFLKGKSMRVADTLTIIKPGK